MLILTIICLILIELFAWTTYKDVKCPAFLHNILWIIVFINILFMSSDISIKNGSGLLIICAGAILFPFGFALGTHIKVDQKRYEITANYQTMKLLISILMIATIPVIIQYIGFIRSYGALYGALLEADENLNLPAFFDYYRKVTQFLFFCFAIVYWMEPVDKRKPLRPYIFVLFVIATLAALSVPTRNSILFYILPLVFIFFCTHGTKNRQIVTVLLISAIGFLFLFYLISTGKYWYMYDNQDTSRMEVITHEFQSYLTGGVIAFTETWSSHSFTRDGGNTFRFIWAIFDALYGTNNAVPLTNEFTMIASDISTNVYTFYDFYIRDFGVAYALIMQFVFAVVHGVSYSKMKKGDLMGIYWFGMLSYPLIMQFFQDQYLSLLSTWIQIAFIGFIVLGTSLFFKKENPE